MPGATPDRAVTAAALVVLALALGAGSGAAGLAQAQPAATQFAVLDVQEVLRAAKAAKALRAQIEREQAEYQDELARQENALRTASDQLMAERDKLAQDEFLRRRQEIDQQVAELRRQSQARKRKLEAAYNDGIDQVRKTMLDIVTQLAAGRGAGLVLNKSSVVAGGEELDMTAEVIDRLDATLPSVEPAQQP